MADNDDDDNHDYYNDFWSNSGGVFEKDDTGVGEGYVYMTLTNSSLPPKEQYDTNITLIHPGVFVVSYSKLLQHVKM